MKYALLARTQDKIAALKGSMNLNKSDGCSGVNPDLTRSQQEKSPLPGLPLLSKARQEGKTTWYVDDTLFINGTRIVPVIVTAQEAGEACVSNCF